MTHVGTQYIKAERLVLRRFEYSDAQAMFNNWASDSAVTKFLTWPAHADVSVTEKILGEWIPQYENSAYYNWAIALEGRDSEPVGNISVGGWLEDGQVPEIGYCMGRRWWHQGVMSEALGAVLDFLFDRVGVERVFAKHDVNNPHSGGVMRKCGMKFLGIREKAARHNQGECDCACYAIEASDR